MGESCQSCGMSIEAGPYCRHCRAPDGGLVPFEEIFERMLQWAKRHEPELDPAEAEARTLRYMATMPAWAEHPRVRRAVEEGS